MTSAKHVVFDIGGTNMRVAAASDDELGEIKKIPTPKNPEDGISQLARLARELGGSFSAAGGDIAGRVSKEGILSDARNLRAWEGVNIVEEVSKALGAPVRVYNDAIVVGLGEAKVGAGKGFSRVTYITVSTGVGGALIKEDRPADSPLLGDLNLRVGDLEAQISGTAIQKKFGIHPKDLDSLEERSKLADILARGLSEISEAWKPDVFVLGGSMIVGKNPIPLERVQESLNKMLTMYPKPPALVMAQLGDNGGLEGGRVLAQSLENGIAL